MSAIIGPNIGGGPRFRFRSRSGSRSGSRSVRRRSPSPPPTGAGGRGRAPFGMAGPRRPKQQPPQAAVDDFWAKFTTKTPGKATTVIPQNHQLVDRVARKNAQAASACPRGSAAKPTTTTATPATPAKTTRSSYDDAAAMCRAKVTKIVDECRRVNKKYRDPHFDLESDLKLGRRDCLQSLANIKGMQMPPGSDLRPRSAKRVTEIFDKPQFYIDGPTANDVRQGRDGDCWLMSALCTLSNKPGLIERLCVAHDQDVGVYGFVFYRDGEWISEIVDDFLFLTKSDYDESYTDRVLFDELERVNPDEAYRRIYQSNSGALYLAQCEHPQETWLPLLEKCYAKAHGDYAAIEGGFGGEGIEDLTGGVTSEIFTTDILDKEYFWKEDLLKVNQDFLFGCSTGVWGSSRWGERKGIMELHSYSIQRAVEVDGLRLVRLKNPWGKGEWKGAWSDGSKEWTPEWLEKLGHRFGDDGDFWITYEDLLRKYQAFERTRLFGDDWCVAQIWTTLTVPWMLDYHDTYFCLSMSQPGPVVIVLSQLDVRYFRGLEGQYDFELALRLHKAGHEDYIVRSQAPYRMRRSINVELELEAGEYDVRIKVNATRDEDILPTEQVIRNSVKERREKLTRIGLAYDLAHGKGKIVETDEEKAAREAHEKKIKSKQRQEIGKKIQSSRENENYLQKKQYQRAKKRRQKARKQHKAMVAARQAKQRVAESQEIEGEGKGFTTKRVPSDGAVDGGEGASDAGAEPSETTEETPEGKIPAGSAEDNQAAPSRKGSVGEAARAHEGTENTPQARGAGTAGEKGPDEAMTSLRYKGPPRRGGVDRACESSDSDFDLDDLDSLSELSEHELDAKIDAHLEQLQRAPPSTPAAPDAADEEPDEFERDPWNAVCVVGLRVYHRGAPDAVRLKVVRPKPYADDDDDDDDGGGGEDAAANGDGAGAGAKADEKSRELDVDDSAKDATLVGEVRDRRKSIMGSNGTLS